MCELTARHGNAMGTAFYVSIGIYTTSEHGASSIITAGPHTSAASSRLNWRPGDLIRLVCFAERWYVVSARVPSHFKRSLRVRAVVLGGGKKCMGNEVRGVAYIRVDDTKLALWTDRHVGQVRYRVGNSSFRFKKNRIVWNLIYHWIIPQIFKDYY